MTTTMLPLTNQAQAMLKEIQRQAGVLSAQVDAVVQQEAQKLQATQATQPTQQTTTAMDCDVLEKILLDAMPAQSQLIQRAKSCGLKHHPDKTNGRFLTQILSMRIEKETAVAYNPPPALHTPRRIDPLYATFTMAPNADVMLLFNARDVDSNGNPLLMKIVARDSADLTKLDLKKYRTDPNGTQPDVVRVKDSASYVETKDIDETEFSFGDPLKQVSIDKSGDEISTSLWVRPDNTDKTNVFAAMRDPSGRFVPNMSQPYAHLNQVRAGDNLDTTPVKTFEDKIRVSLAAKPTLPAGAWLDDGGAGAHVDVTLHVDRGLIFEPGSNASVNVSGFVSAAVSVAVDKADAHLLGNASTSTKASVNASATLRQILTAPITRTAQAQVNGSDRNSSSRALVDVVYADAASRKVGDRNFSPLGDTTVAQADLKTMKMACTAKPMSNPSDPEDDGARVTLALDDAFLNGADYSGYTIVAGFRDEKGQWQEQKRAVAGAQSKRESFSFDVGDFDDQQKKNANLEIRLFNKDNLPAMRVLVPFREIHWGT